MDLLDEVDLAFLEIIEIADDVGLSPTQTRALFRERIEIAYAILESADSDWPDMTSTAIH